MKEKWINENENCLIHNICTQCHLMVNDGFIF